MYVVLVRTCSRCFIFWLLQVKTGKAFCGGARLASQLRLAVDMKNGFSGLRRTDGQPKTRQKFLVRKETHSKHAKSGQYSFGPIKRTCCL